MSSEYDKRIKFDLSKEIMEVDFSGFEFSDSATVNHFYDRIEERIVETGEDMWFFLVNLSGMRIDPSAWGTYAKRGKTLNKAHSQGSVRFDASEVTRKQIERDAKTERFDPNLFTNRADALARIASLPSGRRKKIRHKISFSVDDIKAAGKVFPVNPNTEVVHSIKCYDTVGAIPDPVDMAVVVVPKQIVEGAHVRGCFRPRHDQRAVKRRLPRHRDVIGGFEAGGQDERPASRLAHHKGHFG